jgi:type VI secretion system ImpM family protein
VGFFGKLPGTGDFVQRRLPPAFVAAWDAAFEAGVNAARAAFAADWRAVWQVAPVWRFVLSPGVCGATAWAGVTGPSVDRVGRAFPMVVAAAVADAQALTRIAHDAGGWFDLLGNVCQAANVDAALTAEHFDARVLALPEPLAWIAATQALAPARVDWTQVGVAGVAWHATSADRVLAAWAADCVDAGDGCLWWTRGNHQLPAQARLTRGLPRAETYATFVAGAQATAAVAQPEPMANDIDVLADLVPLTPAAPLDDDNDDTIPMARLHAPRPAVPAPVAPVPESAGGVVCRHAGSTTLIAADNGAFDPRHAAARQVEALLTEPGWDADFAALGARLLALHPALRARGEDLIDPVSEDAAVLVAAVAEGAVHLLRIGAAAAWHWRRGQLRPVFADPAAPLADQADTLRPGDLLGPASSTPGVACGLGAAGRARSENATCLVASGDRLLLMATDTLTALPPAVLAAALAGTTGEVACSRIAAAAGLGTERTRWPLAVIEVGT